jgi:hypothetical protein
MSDPDLEARKQAVKDTLRCPYCDADLVKHDTTGNPFGAWGQGFLYVCFNDRCPYYLESFETMAGQGAHGGAYRFVWDPDKDWCGPVIARGDFAPRKK